MDLKIDYFLWEYEQSMHYMNQLLNNKQPTCWFLEYTPTYTSGSVGRGGGQIYHGPGQRIIYFIAPIHTLAENITNFMDKLENAVVKTCENFRLNAKANLDGRGIWIEDKKAAFIGMRVDKNKWLSHGIAININTDLSKFAAINVCGKNACVCNIGVDIQTFDQELIKQFKKYNWLAD